MNFKHIAFTGTIVLLIICSKFKASAQNLYIKDVQGVPIVTTKSVDINGSQFLYDDWHKATVKLQRGITYNENMYVKFDEEKGQIYFKGTNGDALAFVDPVSEFIIENNSAADAKHFKNGFNNIPGTDENTFFEILADGTYKLLKRTKSFILETKNYDSPVVVKTYTKEIRYYLVSGTKSQQVKNDKKSIFSALGSNQDKLEAYIKQNNLNLKKDEDLAKLITYYNSI